MTPGRGISVWDAVGWTWERVLDKYIQLERCEIPARDMEMRRERGRRGEQHRHRRGWSLESGDAESLEQRLPHHGYSGPVTTARNPIVDPISERFMQAAVELGMLCVCVWTE